jgi:hypothetical protein
MTEGSPIPAQETRPHEVLLFLAQKNLGMNATERAFQSEAEAYTAAEQRLTAIKAAEAADRPQIQLTPRQTAVRQVAQTGIMI